MKVALTTPTGHVGGGVARRLLDSKADLVLLARHPEKVSELAGRGAHVKEGSQDDERFVTEATRGVDLLFWVTPTDPKTDDLRASQNRFGRAAAAAVKANRIPRVVNLSSVGAHNAKGTGPVDGLHDVEGLLDATEAAITHLRPGFFFENYLMMIDGIRSSGSIFMPNHGGTRVPMIATRDIAEAAAKRILDTGWKGRSVMGLHGPADLSFDEAAVAIGEGLRRRVTHVQVPESEARQALLAMGVSPAVADAMLEMHRAMASGVMRPERPRTPETTTPTTLTRWTVEVMAPLV